MRATLEAHLSSRQVARIVYGAIVGLTLVVAVRQHPPTAGVMAAWLLVSALTVALAELYSEVVGAETSERHRVTRRQLAHMLESAGAVALGVGFPAVFFLLAWVHVIELDTAFSDRHLGRAGPHRLLRLLGARFAGARCCARWCRQRWWPLSAAS